MIRLEIGALAAWTPVKSAEIASYAAECYPNVFSQRSTAVLTAAPERTFWEKVTILHHEANRPEHLAMPQRYSRHYYDLYCMASSPVKVNALSQLDLLEKVVDFKTKFYLRAWAKYSEAVQGSLKLIPSAYRFRELTMDYDLMKRSFQNLFDNDTGGTGGIFLPVSIENVRKIQYNASDKFTGRCEN